MPITHLHDYSLSNLKYSRAAARRLTNLREKLGVPTAADALHLLIERYELPDPLPQPPACPARELSCKEIYEPDHKQLRLLKAALNFDSLADVVDELLRAYQQPPPPAPAPTATDGEALFEQILALLERQRKRKRAARRAAREA